MQVSSGNLQSSEFRSNIGHLGRYPFTEVRRLLTTPAVRTLGIAQRPWLGNSSRSPTPLFQMAKGPYKPNSVVCGHSSRRRVTADAHQRPTRRFRQLHEAPSDQKPAAENPARAALARRADTQPEPGSFAPASPPIWSCSVWGLPCPRPYDRSGALLPHLFTLTRLAVQAFAPRASPPASAKGQAGVAVCFLWHWPSTGLEARIPDVIRHTALWSSDFPPPDAPALARKAPAATARSFCQTLVYCQLHNQAAARRITPSGSSLAKLLRNGIFPLVVPLGHRWPGASAAPVQWN